MVGACFRSVPQILRIVRAKRATGVSLTSNVVELLAYSITMAYNFRLGTANARLGRYSMPIFVKSSICLGLLEGISMYALDMSAF